MSVDWTMFQGEPAAGRPSNPLDCRVVNYNREVGEGRVYFTVIIRFEDQEYSLRRFYTCFENLKKEVLGSQYSTLAAGFPPKHPPSLALKKKVALSKTSAYRAENEFLKERSRALEAWLRTLLLEIGVVGVATWSPVDEFLEAFSPGGITGGGQVKLNVSMYHTCAAINVSNVAYQRLYEMGYTFNTLCTISTQDLVSAGVPDEKVMAVNRHFTALRSAQQSHPGDVKVVQRQSTSRIGVAATPTKPFIAGPPPTKVPSQYPTMGTSWMSPDPTIPTAPPPPPYIENLNQQPRVVRSRDMQRRIATSSAHREDVGEVKSRLEAQRNTGTRYGGTYMTDHSSASNNYGPDARSDDGGDVLAFKLPGLMSDAMKACTEGGFEVGGRLGSGAFSSIFRGVRKETGLMVAIKEITKFRTDQTEDENEWTLNLLLSDHPNILTPLAQFRTPLAEVIVSELAPGGDLFDRLEGPGGQVSKELCRKYMFEASLGLAWCHANGVVHADIKLENMLIDAKGCLQLCDFGLAGYVGSERTGRPYGTSAYMAPELVCIRSSRTTYVLDTVYDIWSMGIVLYAIIFADLPWNKARLNNPDFFVFYKSGGVTVDLKPFHLLSRPMRKILKRMLALDPLNRCTMTDVSEFFRMELPWLKEDERHRTHRRSVSEPNKTQKLGNGNSSSLGAVVRDGSDTSPGSRTALTSRSLSGIPAVATLPPLLQFGEKLTQKASGSSSLSNLTTDPGTADTSLPSTLGHNMHRGTPISRTASPASGGGSQVSSPAISPLVVMPTLSRIESESESATLVSAATALLDQVDADLLAEEVGRAEL